MLLRKYNEQELLEILSSSEMKGRKNPTLLFDRIATDSRYAGIGKSSCFFAIKTDRNDGHLYIEDAYNKGARCFVVEKLEEIKKDAIYIKVPNTLNALQELAAFRRKEINYPILGITGSNGKTVVKEWLFQIISNEKVVFRSPKSYNSQIGVALSLLMLPDNADLAIIEAGISMPGEMAILESMIKPDFGLITNVNQAHLENFQSKSNLVSEKVKLFTNSKEIFYRSDYSEIDEALQRQKSTKSGKLISWSDDLSHQSEISVKYSKKKEVTLLEVKFKNQGLKTKLHFTDNASIENAINCIVLSNFLGISLKTIEESVSSLTAVAMRLQLLEGINNCTLVNDSYNSDLTSLEIALDFLNMQKKHLKSTLIISDIYQNGVSESELYQKVDKMCVENGVDRIIGIGKGLMKYSNTFQTTSLAFESTDDFLDEMKNFSFYEESILIKGSRKFEFERISNVLVNKKHETSLEVNLSAVLDNLNFYKSKLKENVGIMVMVKAFSYGTGTFEIANVLEHHGVDYLAVAFLEEGKVLRNNGIKAPIMVMNPAIGELTDFVKYNLEPEIYKLSDLKILANFLKESKASIGVHLKVETGMHRLGFNKEELIDLIDILKDKNRIKVKSVFSHLVSSDDLSNDQFSKEQMKIFEGFCDDLKEAGINTFKKHLLNSDGIIRFMDAQYDMVRLGIGLYGLSSVNENKENLRSVIVLKSRISQLKKLKKGESVGYGRAFIAKHDMITATIPIGYADGLLRELGNGNWYVRIKGHKAPVVGNICMDMTMIDVSDIKGVREKDEVIILNGNKDIYKMAEKRKTIPYEILTSISERVKRVYFYGD